MGVHALAGALELHVNTVRAHLAVLEKAGLVASEREDPARRGRPRLVYRAIDAADAADHEHSARSYRFLAEILAGYVAATVDDPSVAALDAGRAWGHHLVDRPGPFERVQPSVAVERVVTMLDDVGFAPELDTTDPTNPRVLLRRCPFLDVAKDHQQVVCGIHLGLMQGALDELGAPVEARDLLPFVEPDLCVSHFKVPA
jgi:predicted ArsR family transcriptional regulator